MMTLNRKHIGHLVLGILIVFATTQTGCTDVGDDNASGGSQDGLASDAEGPDASVSGDTSTGSDAQSNSDTTVSEDAPVSEEDAEIDSASPPIDSGSVEEVDAAGHEDASVDTGAPEASAPEAGVSEASAPEAGAAEAGAPEAGGPDAGVDAGMVDAGEHDAGEADVLVESGVDSSHGSSPSVPCTATGQTNCVQCDQNMSTLCSQTEAIVVQRDIEKGLVTGDKPTPMIGNNSGSCYECAVENGALDSDIMGFSGEECDDLGATSPQMQLCLNAINCFLGSPQSGTPGANGTNSGATPSELSADCANEDPAGVFNCFCGPAEPDVSDCKSADTVAAANTTGGRGVASPNGACVQQILAGTATTTSTVNPTVITDLNNTSLGAGQAAGLVQLWGTNLTSGQACPQCYQ